MASVSESSAGAGAAGASGASSALPAAPSTAALSAKIEALEPEIKELKGKLTALDGKLTALDVEIAAAEGQHDAAAVERLSAKRLEFKNDRLEAKEEAKQLRAMLIEYQHKENLLLEAQHVQQRAQPSAAASAHTRLLTRGFPALSSASLVNSPSSTPADNNKHQPASISLKDLALLADAAFQAQPVPESQIWAAAAAHAPDPLPWVTESDVQGFVKQALSDCIVSGGLQRQLRLSNKISVDDQRPDVWVLHMGKHEGATLNLPVGVGEVKKPKGRAQPHAAVTPTGSDVLPDIASLSLQSSAAAAAAPAASPTTRSGRLAAKAAAPPSGAVAAAAASSSLSATAAGTARDGGLDKPTLLGQIFDYMCMLRTQHGLRDVFGIVTNYAEWRIVWLPDTEPAAQATVLPFHMAQPVDPDTPLRRELHGTRIHRGDDPSLIPLLVSMLHKMAHSPHEPPAQLVDALRPRWRVAEAPPYHWKRLPDFTLKLLQAVDVRSASFFLLQDYRGGTDGRVWLVAAESSGALGVIKFPRRHLANRKQLQAEAQLWKEVWGSRAARVVILAGEDALLLPFAFHAHREADDSLRFLKPDHLHPDQPASYLSDVSASALDALIAEANADPMAVATEAVSAMADKQYEHADVHWRHVAFIIKRNPRTKQLHRQAVLIDLGRVERLTSTTPSVKAAAVARMLAALK